MTHLSLIGMSNIGKTHWAERLEREGGYERIDCDALVEEELSPQLRALGFTGISDVARWMGQPSESQYAETSETFRRCEREVMLAILERIRARRSGKPFVVDTCGSVIYTGTDISQEMCELTTVVYLQASADHTAELFRRYMAEPKPVIWGSSYAPQSGETPLKSLERCYPLLLQSRALRYEQLAHWAVPFEVHRDMAAGPKAILPELLNESPDRAGGES